MVYGGYRYLDLDYTPSEDDFVVLAWVKGKVKLETLAEALAAESSVGTWTEVKTMNEHVFKNYRARIFKLIKVSENAGFVFIAYPIEHFDIKNLAQFWASVLGNVFGLKELEELYYLDIKIPKKFQKQFDGPLFGLEGVRKYVGTDKTGRPHTGTIVKPKVGLTPKEWADVAYKAWANGLDLVKDDENLVDQDFCKWKERFDYAFDALDKAEAETGEKKLYLTNITDISIERMVERLDYIKERGHKQVMLDVYILGFPALDYILKITKKYKLIVHAHRAGYAAWHRGNFGINFGILTKFYRLLGVDQLHIGTGVGKMEGGTLLIRRFHELAEKQGGVEKLYLGSLDFEFAEHIKPLMPVASGGLDPGRVEALVVVHGLNVTIQAGGGVHGHPRGTEAGARALRTAVEIVARGESIKEYIDKYPELKEAIEKWGYLDPAKYKRILEFEKENKDVLDRMATEGGIGVIKEVIWKI
ncbi:MAG TPA: ribulose-bisphosphate carboxylase large subunit [Candidatus Nanopusillus sp.]|nr:ribulose-bisphosphate carboxylase large subunit [Candidatus Nanopusillus sp.]HIP90352.1 ribulose-bisphosphate carboxylase large subunit [Candidatus Nanopusillus sp.]